MGSISTGLDDSVLIGFLNEQVNMTPEDWFARFREQYGEEYARFLLVEFSEGPRLCPYCKTDTLRKLWLGDPSRKLSDSIWGKWYLWCESCLKGIYCPLGTYAVPKGESYIQWGDESALQKILPPGLQLIRPVVPAEVNAKAGALQQKFDASEKT
jgi:hypothetical protein